MDKANVISALDALAQESRLDIFRLLVEKGPDGIMMGAIGEKLGLPHATLSFHLDKLRQSGLIESEKQGRATIYRANYDVLVGTIQYLTDNCCKESDMTCRIEIKEKTCCEKRKTPMKLSDVKKALSELSDVNFKLPDGTYVPQHFHVTEVGLVTKHFIDCGGVERKETVVNFQLWEADDYDHRIAPQKFLSILDISKKVIGDADDLDIEMEYQQSTIGKFNLEFDDTDFVLVNKQTDCLAKDACGIPEKPEQVQDSCCSPKSGCC